MKKFIKDGIVGYFDILGYQNFLRNNDIRQSIKIIEDYLLRLPEDVKNNWESVRELHGPSLRAHKKFAKLPYHEARDRLADITHNFFKENLNVLFIADTIIFFFDFDNFGYDIEKRWVFLSIVDYLRRFQSYSIS